MSLNNSGSSTGHKLPKYIRCNDCRYKIKKGVERLVKPDVNGIDAVFMAVCPRCSATSFSFLGDLTTPEALAFLDVLALHPGCLSEIQPYQ